MRLLCVMLILILAACGSNAVDFGEGSYSHYEDDKMTGKVWEVRGNNVEVDISEWEKRDRKGPNGTDEGYSYIAKVTDETTIKNENGAEVFIEELKKGQKVLVNPPREGSFEGTPDEIILIEMTHEEKYARMLSQVDGYNLVVMYDDGSILPPEWQEPLYERVLEIADKEVVATWMVYDEKYVVDFKNELGIEQFPALLVFDREKLVFMTYEVEALYEFFRE